MGIAMRIELEGGKYTYVMSEDGRQHALRHGDIWRDLIGDKFVYCLAAHAEELREQNAQLTEALRLFINAQFPVSTEIDPRGYDWCESYLASALANAQKVIGEKP